MFEPRSFEQILTDMIAYMMANTELTDFSVGSVIRTILEAAALEDDEQYFQMVQLLDAFSILTASGADLDRRLADYNIFRLPERPAVVPVKFFNRNLVTDQLAVDAAALAGSVVLFSTSRFPTTGYPYTVRIAEGTARVQDLTVTNNNTTTGTLTVSTPLDAAMFVGDRVTLVDSSSSYTIAIGTIIRTAPTATQSSRTYATVEPATIIPGNYYSNEVLARAQQAGTSSNVGTGRISQFQGSAPFPGCGVQNTQKASSGRDRETDEEFRERGLNKLQSLARGTPLAIKTGVIGVEDPVTRQVVVSANLIEDFVLDEVIVYVDDGTGLDPAVANFPADSTSASVTAGVNTSVILNDASDWPSSGKIFLLDTVNGSEVKSFENRTTNTISFSSAVTFSHPASTLVYLVEEVSAGAETGQRRFKLRHAPVVRGTLRIFVSDGTSYTELEEFTDFRVNKGTGEFQIVDDNGLDEGTTVYATYSYYTNIIAEAQRVLEGDLDNPEAYPGIKAAGIMLSVEAPVIKRITVRASITAAAGFSEASLVDSVAANIEAYINSKKIGEDIIRSKIIDVAHNVRGVADIVVITPTNNITVLDNELPVAYDSSGNSLVTVV
jgi:uncharacterized phage protein gp47/JayE